MTLDALKQALEALPDPSHVEGSTPLSERFAIALPDGDVGAIDDPKFVAWLREHAEPAPFGHGGETKHDPSVRNAWRLKARHGATVAGFDPSTILPAIEAALSPRYHLDARLEDVTLYEVGGKFARHKDTPRTQELVGTLVVALPIAHRGGAFTIVDGGRTRAIDWGSDDPDRQVLRWVALFGDVDHSVAEVTSGARVTLVYSLSRSDRARVDPERERRLAVVREAVATLAIAPDAPLLVPCTRQVILDGEQPTSIEVLRGADREVAEAFLEAGFGVAVRACLAGGGDEDTSFPSPQELYGLTRLSRAIPDDVVESMDHAVSFTDEVDMEEYAEDGAEGDGGGTKLGPYVLDTVWRERCLVRERAAASVIYEGLYSETGYFGNEASFGQIYALAALEITARAR